MQRIGRFVQQITVQTVIPWLTLSDGPEAGEVLDAAGETPLAVAVWEDTLTGESRIIGIPDSAQPLDAAAQSKIEQAHEHEVEEERHHERESYLEFHRVVGWTGRGILTEEAYKFLMTFDKGAAIRKRQREQEWLSGIKARKERHARVDAQFEAQSVCRRARRIALALAEKLLHIEMTAKVQRFEKWQKSRRKVQIYHDRFDSRIAGYTPDQRERLERYRDSLDKQSRFAFKQEKRREAEAKVAGLSRFQVANRDHHDVEGRRYQA
ncbi:hypothetical protein [Hyphomonas sp. UBA3201]|uniref:hypothetical protein n=1 Tax=Hyphomonas sp. UBA3201 TaxID=1946623 RepID=UPI0025B8ABA4|nr:hypothetical protein [Hyphomonas sp. UBA3201]